MPGPTLKDILTNPSIKESLTDAQLAKVVDQFRRLRSGKGRPELDYGPADFAARYSRGEWVHARHLDYLSEVLQKVERREIKRLLVCMPPRHGKSYLIDWYFPAYWLTKFAKDRVILAGYGEQFARIWGARVRDLIIEHSTELNLTINKQFVAADDWQLDTGGGMLSVGVGGAIMGRGANLLIIDDPIKSEEEANSEVYREKMWDWWQTTAYTRLEPNGVVICVMTRWHEDDLFGRIIAADEKKEWTVVNIPALALPGDLIGRAVGEPLWPERFEDDPMYEQKQRVLSPWWWSALYQQNPSPPLGGMLQRDWWQWFTQEPDVMAPKDCDQWLQSWDLSLKDKATNDYCVGQVWARKGANMYLIDQVRGHFNLHEVQNHMINFAVKYPKALAKLVEDTAMGPALKQTLQNRVQGIIPINVAGVSKRSRVENSVPLVQGHNVFLPMSSREEKSQWVWGFVDECAAFPKGANDDQVDAFTQACAFMQPVAWSQMMREQREKEAEGTAIGPAEVQSRGIREIFKRALDKSARKINGGNRRRKIW